MMFSSLTPEDRDIETVVRTYFECRHGDFPQGDGRDDCVMCAPVWTEEPAEFMPANPILVHAREASVFSALAWLDAYDAFGGYTSWPADHPFVVSTPEQIDHARRVLARLSTLTNGETMIDSIAQSNAEQSEFYRTHDRTEEARPGWDDLTDAEKIEAIRRNDPISHMEDTSGSASSQHYIETGRRLTNGEVFDFERIQQGHPTLYPEPASPALEDVFDESQAAWIRASNQAFIVATVLRVAVEAGTKVPDFVQAELDAWRELDAIATAARRVVLNQGATEIEGDN